MPIDGIDTPLASADIMQQLGLQRLMYNVHDHNNNNNNLTCKAPVCAKKTSVALKWHRRMPDRNYTLKNLSYRFKTWRQLHVGLLVRPKTIVFGRTYVLRVIATRDLRDAWADRREILHDGQYWAQFYNAGPKFGGAHPKKISGAKNMQNLARFRTTSKFGGEYLRNG